MRFSASMLSRWMSCPLQVKFRDIESRPEQQNAKTTFGTCIHNALEYYNKTGDYTKSLERFEYYWAHPDQLGASIDVWPKLTTYGSLLSKGRDVLEKYHQTQRWDKREVIAAEHKFVVPLGDHEISGIIDLVEVKKSSKGVKSLAVVDYKTTAKQPTIMDLRLNIQMTFYAYAVDQPEFWLGWPGHSDPISDNAEELYEYTKDMPRATFWYHLWTNKEMFAGTRDEDDFMRMYRAIVEIVNAVDKEVYVPNISGSSCGWCPFTDVCKVTLPVRDKLDWQQPAPVF